MTELADKEVISETCRHIRFTLLRYMPDAMPFSVEKIAEYMQFTEGLEKLLEQIESLLTDFIKEYVNYDR